VLPLLVRVHLCLMPSGQSSPQAGAMIPQSKPIIAASKIMDFIESPVVMLVCLYDIPIPRIGYPSADIIHKVSGAG
jgi:hypothetical protein